MAGHTHREHSGERLVAEARDRADRCRRTMDRDARGRLRRAGRARPPGFGLRPGRESVSSLRGKRVAPNSVYRILDLFVRTNLARRVESANAYIANSHPGCRHDCIFLICDDCGQAVHIDDDALTGSLVSAARKPASPTCARWSNCAAPAPIAAKLGVRPERCLPSPNASCSRKFVRLSTLPSGSVNQATLALPSGVVQIPSASWPKPS